MNLSKSILAKIAAYNSTWFVGHDSKRFVQFPDGGVILIQHHPGFDNTVITIFAIGKSNEKLSSKQISKLSNYHPLYIVIPYDIISSKLLLELSLIKNQWQEKCLYISSYDLKNSPSEGFKIFVVADVGKDPSTGEIRYATCTFEDDASLADVIKDSLFKHQGEPDLDPYSLPSEDMMIALKVFFLKTKVKGTTLSKVNEYIKSVKTIA